MQIVVRYRIKSNRTTKEKNRDVGGMADKLAAHDNSRRSIVVNQKILGAIRSR